MKFLRFLVRDINNLLRRGVVFCRICINLCAADAVTVEGNIFPVCGADNIPLQIGTVNLCTNALQPLQGFFLRMMIAVAYADADDGIFRLYRLQKCLTA